MVKGLVVPVKLISLDSSKILPTNNRAKFQPFNYEFEDIFN